MFTMCAPGLIARTRRHRAGGGSRRSRARRPRRGRTGEQLGRASPPPRPRRARAGRRAPESDHVHVERERAPRHLGADRAQARRARRSSPSSTSRPAPPQRSGGSESQVSGSRFANASIVASTNSAIGTALAPREQVNTRSSTTSSGKPSTPAAERVEPAHAGGASPPARAPRASCDERQQDLGVGRTARRRRRPRHLGVAETLACSTRGDHGRPCSPTAHGDRASAHPRERASLSTPMVCTAPRCSCEVVGRLGGLDEPAGRAHREDLDEREAVAARAGSRTPRWIIFFVRATVAGVVHRAARDVGRAFELAR